MIRLAQISLFIFAIYVSSCSSEGSNGNNPPILVYNGLEKEVMSQGDGTDSVIISLTFEDIDGDIGGTNAANIVVQDNRDGSEYITLSFPDLPKNGKAQQGSLRLTIPNTCCTYPPSANTPACDRNPRFPRNRFTLDISIFDLNGNISNVITTDSLTLNCF